MGPTIPALDAGVGAPPPLPKSPVFSSLVLRQPSPGIVMSRI